MRMHPKDEEKTSFIIEEGMFCYTKMTFRIKNVEATYQRLCSKINLGKHMEAYMNDMMTKSQKHRRSFGVLRWYKVKLNPKKFFLALL